MPQTCKACHHPDRAAIDGAIVAGEPNRLIASRCDVSEASIRRHAAHVHEALALAARAEEATRADDLLGILREAVSDARRLRKKAEDQGDYRGAIGAVKALADVVEVLARVAEKLAESRSRLLDDPEWLALRQRMADALLPYPDALHAVLEAIRKTEAESPPRPAPVLVTLKLPPSPAA